MRTIRLLSVLVCNLLLSVFSHADCVKDHRTNKRAEVLVAEYNITGTQQLTSHELSSIKSDLLGSCFSDNSEEFAERIKDAFQNRGFFLASVKSVRIKANDPLSVPKPVLIEAEVSEGPRCKFGQIRFTGNHAFPGERLLAEFPVKKGDLFQRGKVGSGLEKVRNLYTANGYIDVTMVPDVLLVGNRVNLIIGVEEGSQFHMGKLEIIARGEQADKLRTAWGLAEGAVFDFSYLEKYVNDNSASLPANVTPRFPQLVRNCRESTIEVRLPVDPLDPRSLVKPKDVDCDSQDARVEH